MTDNVSLPGPVIFKSYFDLQESDMARQIRDETESLHNALRSIAESVLNDAADDEIQPERETALSRARSTSPVARAKSPGLRARSKSPLDRSRSPAFADATFSAVQAALNKRQLQVCWYKFTSFKWPILKWLVLQSFWCKYWINGLNLKEKQSTLKAGAV